MPPQVQQESPSTPTITPPPSLPPLLLARQRYNSNDPYGLSSIYQLISSLNNPAHYSAYSYDYNSAYSSLLSEFASLYPSYSWPTDFSQFLATPTAPRKTGIGAAPTATGKTGLGGGAAATATGTGTGTALNNLNNDGNGNANGDGNGNGNGNGNGIGTGGGLSTGAKIGIGVGVPLAIALLVGIGVVLWCAGKRKGKKNSQTSGFAPQGPQQDMTQQQYQQQQVYAPGPQGYIQGYQAPPQQQMSPPPLYMQPQGHAELQGQYGGYAKEPVPGVVPVEMEQEYHFARPGVVEMDAGVPVTGQHQGGR